MSHGTRDASASRPSVGRATALVLLSACGFGSIAIFTVLATRTGASLLTVLIGRYAGATLLLAAIGGARLRGVPPARAWRIMLFAGAGQALLAYVSLYSLRYITASTLVFLFYTYPAWIALFGALRGTERIDATRAAALALALGGVAAMVGAPGSAALHPIGAALALGCAVVYALYVPMIDHLQRGLDAFATTTYISVGVALILGTAAVVTGGVSFDLDPVAWAAIAALASFSTVVAFISFLRGLAVLGPVRTAIASTIEPFWTTLLGALVLTQPLTANAALGGTLIAAAVLLLQRASARVVEA